MNRVQQTKADLETSLQEQIALLVRDCRDYDAGMTAAAKSIAVKLRVLLHDGKGQNKSLLGQLNLKHRPYYDTGKQKRKHGPKLASGSFLVVVHAEKKKDTLHCSFRPKLSEGDEPLRLSAFEVWWNDPVIVIEPGKSFHRRDVILHIADTDGGAHVDAALDSQYLGLKRGESLPVWTRDDAIFFGSLPLGNGMPVRGFETAIIRQIAHEVLLTLERVRPDLVVGYPYSY